MNILLDPAPTCTFDPARGIYPWDCGCPTCQQDAAEMAAYEVATLDPTPEADAAA